MDRVTEEFSFPRMSDSCADNIDSPPLWNLSPAVSPKYSYKGEQNDYCCFGAKGTAHHQALKKSFSDDDDDKDRMDSLWEDLNDEELSSSSTTTDSAASSSREAVQLIRSCAPVRAPAIVLPSNNRPAGMVLIVKVMKKLFSVKSSHAKSRKRSET